jgi:hypothetical protein
MASVSATSPTQFNTGGSLVVAGTTITAPENLLVQFPAMFVSFLDSSKSAGQYDGFEINVEGNYVRAIVQVEAHVLTRFRLTHRRLPVVSSILS